MRCKLTLALACAGLAVFAHADIIDDQDTATALEDDEQQILDEVITNATRPGADAPKTGKVYFRPILFARSRQNIVNIDRIEIVFTAIEQDENGFARKFRDQNRVSYRETLQIPSPDFATRFKINEDAYHTKEINMAGGTYAISEIKYFWIDVDSTANIQRITTYCLSEATIAFDVENGEAKYLGALGLDELPGNTSRLAHHSPFIGLNPDLETATDEAGRIEDLQLLDFDGVEFAEDSGICTDSNYQTAGWKIQNSSSSR